MKTYIGTKIVFAEPAEDGFGRDGYRVATPGGAESWSPKDVFEDAYNDIHGKMTFGDALFLLKHGEKLRRTHWNLDTFLWLIPQNTLKSSDLKDDCIPKKLADLNGGEIAILGTLCYSTYDTDGNRVLMSGWVPSQYDLLVEDWEVVE